MADVMSLLGVMCVKGEPIQGDMVGDPTNWDVVEDLTSLDVKEYLTKLGCIHHQQARRSSPANFGDFKKPSDLGTRKGVHQSAERTSLFIP